jgi:hypothetical protein
MISCCTSVEPADAHEVGYLTSNDVDGGTSHETGHSWRHIIRKGRCRRE